MSNPSPSVATACKNAVKEAVTIALSKFGSIEIPTRERTFWIWHQKTDGVHESRQLDQKRPNIDLVLAQILPQLQTTRHWAEALTSLDSFVKSTNLGPPGLWPQDIGNSTLPNLLRLYFHRVCRIAFDSRMADKIMRQFIQELQAAVFEVRTRIVLDGFRAESPVWLNKKTVLRPSTEEDLGAFVELRGSSHPIMEHSIPMPKSDWWLCEAYLDNPRGTADGMNRVNELTEHLALSLGSFKAGTLMIGAPRTESASPVLQIGISYGGQLRRISTGTSPYRLSKSEIPRFRRFWNAIESLLVKKSHYLQVPLRRLLMAGERTRREDALVDYVIGLEALLGTEDERTELGFRFRVRGAALLSKKRTERKTNLEILKSLYNLRSRIVHGQLVPSSELETSTPLAEAALRNVWRWYFEYWPNQEDNKAGVKHIDQAVLGL